ncbi:uncharacterized protein LOC113348517 [Papaver somniferum]|uniref:uncharacterized protein LOC113348517 n=1 Tax=Papaver somniferum TaxID=3469 RepID=UPI000E702595|nr:uncharacterized protein LOC113348517 [Papaver somniferum]
MKNTFITLIPKKDTVEEIKDLRPVSLVHGVYKIISKVLAERLKKVLPLVISSEQTTFIKKRQILDGVLVANELIDSRIRSGKPGLLVKFNFEKDFDHVNWDFLDEIMDKMGFGLQWRKWLRCCVEYVRFYVLINGSAVGYFKRKKGIRQGDHLSPFLFLLVGEALSYMIKQAQEQGLISGFQVVEGGKLVSHLQFADDTLIFLDAVLNRGGKITLIKSVLPSLPTFYMSLFEMPVSLAKRLEKLMRDFLWDDKGKKKMHLVKWSVLYKRKKYGGLGNKILKKMNQALLSKWLWRFAKEDDVLWRNIIAEKYGIDGVEWLSKTPNGSFGRAIFPNLYQLSRKKNYFVYECYNADSPNFKWSLEEEDVLEWSLTSKKNYTVKSTYDSLSNAKIETSDNNIFKLIWRLKIPPKIGFFNGPLLIQDYPLEIS